jgi:hypothetical protein
MDYVTNHWGIKLDDQRFTTKTGSISLIIILKQITRTTITDIHAAR